MQTQVFINIDDYFFGLILINPFSLRLSEQAINLLYFKKTIWNHSWSIHSTIDLLYIIWKLESDWLKGNSMHQRPNLSEPNYKWNKNDFFKNIQNKFHRIKNLDMFWKHRKWISFYWLTIRWQKWKWEKQQKISSRKLLKQLSLFRKSNRKNYELII